MSSSKRPAQDDLPEGFSYSGRAKRQRILHRKKVGDDTKDIEVCGYIRCVGSTRDEVGQSYGKEIEFISEDNKLHTAVISNADLQGDAGELRKRLADQGLWISTSRLARDSFSQLLNTLKAPRQIVTVSTAGWHFVGEPPFTCPVFVGPLGHVIRGHSIWDKDDETPVVPDDGEGRNGVIYRLDPLRGAQDKRVGGSYKAWKECVGDRIFRDETPHFVLGLYAGCAGTVIQYAGEASSGVHFVGGSSGGKTTSQVVGASCWGNPLPDKSVLISCRATDNAFDSKFVLSNGASVHLDEARTGVDKVIANLAFQFASGAGKARLRPDGTPRKILTWSGFMTLSSEKSLAHYAARAGDQVIAGGVVRLSSIDISGLPPIDPNEARAIKEAALENYGHVGPRFAQALLEKTPQQVRAMIDDAESDFPIGDAPPTVARVRRVFATLYVVGYIMREAGIVSASDQIVYRYARWGWDNFLAGEQADALNPAAQSVDALLLWLRSNQHVVRPIGDDKYTHREVLAWHDERSVYIPKDNLAKNPTLTTSTKAVLEELDKRALLLWAGKNRVHSFIPQVGRIAHYRIELTIDVTGDTEEEQEEVEVIRDLGGNEFTQAAASA